MHVQVAPNKRQQGLERGRKQAASVKPEESKRQLEAAFKSLHELFPTAMDLDPARAIREFDAERLASQPSLSAFPELNGHIELLRAEREAFREATGLDATATAFQFSWTFFLSRRITSQHLARYDLLPAPAQPACTNVFFPDGIDGVTISDNRDVPLDPMYAKKLPKWRPEHLLKQNPLNWSQGTVSSAVLLDDEPQCLFPANPFEYDLIPDECFDDIDDLCRFMEQYREFWGPHNGILMDRQQNAVAVEKTNCRVAFRKPTVNGAIAVTACAYLNEKLHQHQMERTRQAMALKGETTENSLDMNYHLGARRRYNRLVTLANAEAKKGATIWGALDVVADHAVPYPERVCLAGEKTFPDREPTANWSVVQHAAVISGDKKRCLYRSVQDYQNPRPVYDETPKLMLGKGVKMDPAWQADVDAGRCALTPSVE